MSDNESEPPILRTALPNTGAGSLRAPLGSEYGINELAELVADLLAATQLVPADRLALARGRARRPARSRRRSSRRASPPAKASRGSLAARHQLPLVDLAVERRRRRARASSSRSTCSSASSRSRTRCAGRPAPRRVADPANIHGIDELRLATRHPVELGVAARDDILARDRRRSPAPRRRSRRSRALDDVEVDDRGGDRPRGRRRRLRRAARPARQLRSSSRPPRTAPPTSTSSPRRTALVVRFRVDGVLQEMQRIPKRMSAGVTTRLKVLAKLDIAERRKPQDGRISLNAAAAGRMLDIRVATLPTVEGEPVVMRLLDKSQHAADARRSSASPRRCASGSRSSSSGRPARCSSPARPAPVSRRRSTRR